MAKQIYYIRIMVLKPTRTERLLVDNETDQPAEFESYSEAVDWINDGDNALPDTYYTPVEAFKAED